MSSYYYFASSLPMLFFHHGMPQLSYGSFIEDCTRLVSKEDFEQIRMARFNPPRFFRQAHPVLKRWQKADFAVRNELVRMRAKGLNLDPQPFLRTEFIDPSYSNLVKENVEEFTPLRADMHLMELQWKILDDLLTGHQFDLDFLVIYALKLQLLERKASFEVESGKNRLDAIISRSRVDGE